MNVERRSWGVVVTLGPDEFIQAQWHHTFHCVYIEYIRQGRVRKTILTSEDRAPYAIIDLLRRV